MKRTTLVTLFLMSFAGSALALDAKVTKPSTASAKAVWATVGDFCNIQAWHPAVEKCAISKKDDTTFRTLSLKGGGTILEKLVAWDDAGMSYTYTIEESPLPVANYKSTLKVVPGDKGATVDWSGSFDAKDAPDADVVKTITGIYQAGVDVLAATKDASVEINEVNKSFETAFAKGDAAGLAAVYTKNGQILPPNGKMQTGIPAIQKFWQGAIDLGIASATLKSVELEMHGDTAIEVGQYALKTKDGKLADEGKYIVVWKKEGGSWKWHRDIWNSSRPAA